MPAPDLTRLNDNERSALTLLASGHTVKSIARQTGHSEASINERLREARRKTGVGSSRELARLLAQENGDKEIGVAAPNDLDASPGSEAPGMSVGGLKPKGIILMSTIILGSAVAAALAMTSAPDSPASAPPVSEFEFPDYPSPKATHDKLMAEPRDQAWASATETAIQKQYGKVKNTDPVRVVCGSTICEVYGKFSTHKSPEYDIAMRELQTKEFTNSVEAQGLNSGVLGFGGSDSGYDFYAFWLRKPVAQ